MWTQNNYRRIFLDMHIDDHNDVFLSKLNPQELIDTIAGCGAQCVVVKAKPHTGLCYWPCSVGRMHSGLDGMDYVGTMIKLSHEAGMDVVVYYSQIFDNWAYDNHPSWRTVWCDGLNSREKEHHFFRKGRYGECCPNNKEYRSYVEHNLQELCRLYQFEGMFLDMPFWPEVCYCAACRERYHEETHKDLPRFVDWYDPQWRAFQLLREKWIGDFAAFSTACVKAVNPNVTIEHNFATAMFPWQFACSDFVAMASDYAGGDYYGGFLQQTFACKYYRNVSKTLPFCYISSRCDPDLLHHTTTKTVEQFIQHGITALVHNGAFSICDGMNPDGTIQKSAYAIPIKAAFDATRPFEPYVNGEYFCNIAIWFASHSKYDVKQNKKRVVEQTIDIEGFAESKVCMAGILRDANLPFDVVHSAGISSLETDVLVISDVVSILDAEMSDIETYIKRGGNLYISGHIGHPRLLELIGVTYIGTTEHTLTYMAPTPDGDMYFDGFDTNNPMSVGCVQHIVKPYGDARILATTTLPYTNPNEPDFASIHADPPGIPTEHPAVLQKSVGKGRIIWAAAPIEKSRPYMSRLVVLRLVRSLCNSIHFTSNAPTHIEVMGWQKNGKRYYSFINQQETMPLSASHGIYIDLPELVEHAELLRGGALTVEVRGDNSRIYLPDIDIFSIVEVTPKGDTTC